MPVAVAETREHVHVEVINMSYFNFDFTRVDIKKNFDTDIKLDVDIKYDLDVKIDKDINIDVKADTDLKLDWGHVATATGKFQNDSPFLFEVLGAVGTETDLFGSSSFGAGLVSGLWGDVSSVQVTADAKGFATFTEIDISVDVYDFGSVTTVSSVSMTDLIPN